MMAGPPRDRAILDCDHDRREHPATTAAASSAPHEAPAHSPAKWQFSLHPSAETVDISATAFGSFRPGGPTSLAELRSGLAPTSLALLGARTDSFFPSERLAPTIRQDVLSTTKAPKGALNRDRSRALIELSGGLPAPLAGAPHP